MADTDLPASEDTTAQSGAPGPRVGLLLREARERAGLDIAKVSADLRISASQLEALEAGDYGRLAGAPYARALLVSLSRYYKLDSRELLDAYARETGARAEEAAPVSPYKDDSKTHAKAHKQIFILLLAVLLLILLLIMGKFGTSTPEYTGPEPAADTTVNVEAAPDSLADSVHVDSTLVDSTALDSAAAAPGDSAARALAAKAEPSPVKAEVSRPGPAAVETAEPAKPVKPAKRIPTTVRIQALSDSVYIRVMGEGRRESSRTLGPGESFEARNDDIITFVTRASGSVEVTAGGTSVIPDKRRFKVSGTTIEY